jgi:hypothetical protein
MNNLVVEVECVKKFIAKEKEATTTSVTFQYGDNVQVDYYSFDNEYDLFDVGEKYTIEIKLKERN